MKLPLMLGLLALGWLASPAQGYVLSGRSWPQSAPGEPITVTYSYQNLFDGGLLNPAEMSLTEADLRLAVEEAFTVWTEVVPIHFVEVTDDHSPVNTFNYPAGEYGTIRIGHRHIDGAGTAKAIAWFPPLAISGACTICGDIHFDHSDRWSTVGTLELPDILGAAIHEIGHAIGLNHTDVEEANMFPVFRRHTGPGSGWLHPDDVAGAQAIYGSGVGSVTPLLRVPEPTTCLILLQLVAGLFMWRLRRSCRE